MALNSVMPSVGFFMNNNAKYFFKRLDSKVDQVRLISRGFCDGLSLTGFAYVRVYHDGRAGWVTTDSDHDRLLFDTGFLKEDPLIDTAKALEQGYYIWSHDRSFPGDKKFYENRVKHFHINHGLVVVNHQKDYLETGCFSGCTSKRPLHNVFFNEKGLFKAYLNYFSQNLPKSMHSLFEEGLHLKDLKTSYGTPSSNVTNTQRKLLIAECGLGRLLRLSRRELECLALLREGLTYQSIGLWLKLSPRTVESYIQSVKNKLDLKTHAELFQLANTLSLLGLEPKDFS